MEKGGAVRTAAALTPFFEWAGTLANIIEPAGFGEYSPAFSMQRWALTCFYCR